MNLSSRNKEIFLASLLALFCTYDVLNALVTVWGFTTDDAYISWVYARQLVNGKGLLWPGSLFLVEGYSNFLWVLIAALVIKVKLPLLVTMKSISCVSLIAGFLCLYRLGRLFFSPLLAMLPLFIYSHYYGLIWWTVGGLETILYSTLSIFLVWQIALVFGYQAENQNKTGSKDTTWPWLFTNITLLLLSLTRFEGLIWVIPVLIFALCELRNRKIALFLLNKKIVSIWVSISLIFFILPYFGYFIWRLYYFGKLIPNSYSCKALSQGKFLVVDLDYLKIFFP